MLLAAESSLPPPSYVKKECHPSACPDTYQVTLSGCVGTFIYHVTVASGMLPQDPHTKGSGCCWPMHIRLCMGLLAADGTFRRWDKLEGSMSLKVTLGQQSLFPIKEPKRRAEESLRCSKIKSEDSKRIAR